MLRNNLLIMAIVALALGFWAAGAEAANHGGHHGRSHGHARIAYRHSGHAGHFYGRRRYFPFGVGTYGYGFYAPYRYGYWGDCDSSYYYPRARCWIY